MISFPQCKINIGLNIHYKREDNFHEISSVMFPVPLNDIVEIIRNDDFKFTHSGLAIPGSTEDNLCVKAYELVNEKYSISPIHAHLYKNIPMGGGLGGGSADATEILKLLNLEFKLNLDNLELKKIAAKLGSDCAFFVENRPQYATGRGEVLESIDLDLTGYHLLLINDGTHVSTKEAYAKVDPKTPSEDLKDLIHLPVSEWRGRIKNQFEESVFQSYPHLKKLKEKLYDIGAEYASMTGSGATIYGIFKNVPQLDGGFSKALDFKQVIKI